jgi:lipoyl(octanoyl) transferase
MSLEFERVGFVPQPVPYLQGWDLQRQVHADVVAGERPDTVLLLEHEAVYTAGKRTEPHERPFDGTPVIDVDRGGKITWHGPASSSATRSCGSPSRSTWWRTCGAWSR